MRLRNNRLHLVSVLTVVLAAQFAVSLDAVSAGGGGCHGARENEAHGSEVTMAGCFSPTVLRVEPGTRISFQNKDPYPHVVIGQTWAVEGNVASGAAADVLFPTSGTYPYACTLHPGMVGVVVVGDGRLAATSKVLVSASAPPAQPKPAAAETADGARRSGSMQGPAWLAVGVAGGAAVSGATAVAIRQRRRRTS